MRAFLKRLDRVVGAFGWKWDSAAKVLWIPDWLEDNKPQSPNVCKSWRRLLGDVPDCELKLEAIVAIKVFLKDFEEGFAKAFGEPSCTLPATFPKTSGIQGAGSTEYGSESREHSPAALRATDPPSSSKKKNGQEGNRSESNNGAQREVPAHLAKLVGEAVTATGKNKSDDEYAETLMDLHQRTRGERCSKPEAMEAVGAFMERRASA